MKQFVQHTAHNGFLGVTWFSREINENQILIVNLPLEIGSFEPIDGNDAQILIDIRKNYIQRHF